MRSKVNAHYSWIMRVKMGRRVVFVFVNCVSAEASERVV